MNNNLIIDKSREFIASGFFKLPIWAGQSFCPPLVKTEMTQLRIIGMLIVFNNKT